YWFLEDIRRGDKYCLEGYLFPDTYRFYTNDAPGNVIKKFLDGFDYRFTDVMEEKLQTIEERTGLSLSMRQVVIIASIIEKETAGDADSYDISSVVYNRLKNAADYPYLNMDATLIYALGGNIDPETGLSKPLTEEDMYMDHPYNTYVYRGLPPGPISNPGRNSLDAALDPNSTNYFYYVYNPYSGKHIFARSLYEQEQNINYINSLG
ncbi:MAG: endolytic transglycosylase MltG, partial [Oscillospiraceae bacterium]|nr:endolytic transglycosylase MltG [Oscillospiraceae bacterium]